jgi:uncharacterized membrane protein
MTPNREIMKAARASLVGHWGWAALGSAIYMVITMGISFLPVEPWLTSPLSLLVTGPMVLGFYAFVLALQSSGEASLGQLFDGFDGFGRFGTAVGGYLLMTLFVILWMLLLIVPGIVAMYSYAMTFWILADDAHAGPLEAISRSKALMRGHRWQLFRLYWRFFGWFVLSLLTLGIALFWLVPYVMMSSAEFYRQLRQENGEALAG